MESLQVKQTWTQGDLVAIVLCHTFSSSVLGISIISYTCEMENHGASQHCFFFFIYIYTRRLPKEWPTIRYDLAFHIFRVK